MRTQTHVNTLIGYNNVNLFMQTHHMAYNIQLEYPQLIKIK